jgi:hypothetical protein
VPNTRYLFAGFSWDDTSIEIISEDFAMSKFGSGGESNPSIKPYELS